ncbi:MAG: SHOCT domain-containing protein [Proteobacteria bacterium]|nr:SHOCT domain-containing protein [Pseudomonadota bacterium]
MKAIFHKAAATGLVLAATVPAALADSPAAGTVVNGMGNFQGPGWSGYGPGPWMMGGWGGGPMMGYGGWGGYGGGGWIMMILGTMIIVALLVFIFRLSAWTARPPHQPMHHNRANSAGLHALDERYARGEINREEYLQKKRDILEG